MFLVVLLALGAPHAREDPARLAKALATVDPRALESDVRFLADDALAGRDTPSTGLEVAALFLATRLDRLGFESAGSGDLFHRWELTRTGLDVERSSVTIELAAGTETLVPGRDYFLARMTHAFPLDVVGEVVSVGEGSQADFEETELMGAWALVLDRGASMRSVQRRAERAGALGVVFAETPELGRSYVERYGSTIDAVSGEKLVYGTPGSRTSEDPPVVMLARSGVERLLAGSEIPATGVRLAASLRERRVVHSGSVEVKNVAGFWRGRDPELAGEVLIVSAHYDHVGIEGQAIYNGADDNASGTAGLLGVAEALAAYGPLRRSVLLLFVSGEEKGLWGSAAWTKDPVLPEGCLPVADLNIDMIGRTDPDELYLTPTSRHVSFNRVAQAAYELAPFEGFPELASQDEDWRRSDHYNFDANLSIPVAFLSAGEHPDYHEPSDTAEKIDYDKLARITRLVVRILDRVEDGPLR